MNLMQGLEEVRAQATKGDVSMTDVSEETFLEFIGQVREHITKALAFLRPLIREDQPAELLLLAGYLKKSKCIADGLSEQGENS